MGEKLVLENEIKADYKIPFEPYQFLIFFFFNLDNSPTTQNIQLVPLEESQWPIRHEKKFHKI